MESAANVEPSSNLPFDVLAEFVPYADWETLLAWRCTSRTFFTVVSTHLRLRYEYYVTPFAHDVSLFNRIIRAHAAVISGPAVVDFFAPASTWAHSQLDIYLPVSTYKQFLCVAPAALNWQSAPVPLDKPATSVHEYTSADPVVRGYGHTVVHHRRLDRTCFTDNVVPFRRGLLPLSCVTIAQGCLSTYNHGLEDDTGPDSDGASDSSGSLPTMSTWRRSFLRVESYTTGSGLRINLFSSHSSNPVTPIRFVWSSLLVNFITPDTCVCGFPSQTLRRRAAFRIGSRTASRSATVQAYIEQGFVFRDYRLEDTLDTWDCVFFGERRLLAIDFRPSFDSRTSPLPIQPTQRGWIANPRWVNARTATGGDAGVESDLGHPPIDHAASSSTASPSCLL